MNLQGTPVLLASVERSPFTGSVTASALDTAFGSWQLLGISAEDRSSARLPHHFWTLPNNNTEINKSKPALSHPQAMSGSDD